MKPPLLMISSHPFPPQEAKPLLQQSIRLVGEVTPLLAELREGGLVENLEALTATAAGAAADIQKLQVIRGLSAMFIPWAIDG